MRRIVLLVLMFFLFFVPLGSAPIYIGNLKLDNLVGVLLLVVVLLYLIAQARMFSPDWLVWSSTTLYFTVAFLAVLLSSDPMYSLYRFLIIFGYAFVAFVIPYMFADRVKLFGYAMISFAVISASLIWLSYFILGMSSWGRMTIPTYNNGSFSYFPEGWGSSADPNILGFGLVLSCLFFLGSQERIRWFKLGLVVFVFSATMLTLSRTAIISFVLALLCTVTLFFLLRMLSQQHALKINSKLLAKLVFIITVFGSIIVLICPFDLLLQRILQGDQTRLDIMKHSIDAWLNNDKTILLGLGFDMSRMMIDSHNIYLNTLHDMGLMGLLAFLSIFSVVFNVVMNIKISHVRFWALVIFFYIAIAGLTYWHTKTLWVSLMFCLLLASYDRWAQKY